jgi:hypothetical protein
LSSGKVFNHLSKLPLFRPTRKRQVKMSEENNKSQNQEQPRRFNQQQYDLLKKCSDKKDMTEWNEWRKKNPNEVVWLQGAYFEGWHLQEVNFMHANQRCKKN